MTASAQNTASNPREPLAEAIQKLFPPLRNRTLSEAAGALADNRVGVAEAMLASFLEKKPNDLEALNLAAEIARRAGRFTEAAGLLARCVAGATKNIGFRYSYVVVLQHLEKYDQAMAQLDELLREDPGNPLFRYQKANILARSGKRAEALVCRRDLTQDFPLWSEGWLNLARALRDEGRQAECIAAFHRALELDPASTPAYVGLASLKIYRFTEAEVAQMERQLAGRELSSDARSDLHHALGNAYGQVKNYARSFENYARGNALRRIGVAFDPEKSSTHRRACEGAFSETFFRERAGWGCPSGEAIFIIGLPRSGSTLIEQILSSHSSIEGLGELADLDSALVASLSRLRKDIRVGEFAHANAVDKSALMLACIPHLGEFSDSDFGAMGEEYLTVTRARRIAGRPFFSDKTLRNFLYVGLIHLMLPNAKIIDARRHPLDCGWSCFTSQFRGNHFSLRLSDIGNDYANYVRLMAHFDRVLPGRIHRVIHEDLLADPETEIRRLLEYLKLPFEQQCLRFHEVERAVITQSSEQVRKPLNKEGMGRWNAYEPWLDPLKSALGPVLDCYPRVPE